MLVAMPSVCSSWSVASRITSLSVIVSLGAPASRNASVGEPPCSATCLQLPRHLGRVVLEDDDAGERLKMSKPTIAPLVNLGEPGNVVIKRTCFSTILPLLIFDIRQITRFDRSVVGRFVVLTAAVHEFVNHGAGDKPSADTEGQVSVSDIVAGHAGAKQSGGQLPYRARPWHCQTCSLAIPACREHNCLQRICGIWENLGLFNARQDIFGSLDRVLMIGRNDFVIFVRWRPVPNVQR